MNIFKPASALLFVTALFFLTPGIKAQVDTDPEPYGGNQLMRDFICDEMIYPETAIRDKTEGTVEIAFTVMQDGKKTNYRIKESVSPELDSEAMRICKLLLYYPAIKSSNRIIAEVVIPVKFNIKKYNRNCKRMGMEDYSVYEGSMDTSLLIYSSAALDKMPSPAFKDPRMSFGRFIVENMKYPDLAYRQNITGEVELSFVVETSGRVSNIEIVRPLGGGCTEEAIQLLRRILWKPGIIGQQAVRSFMSASIHFSLDDNSGHKYLPNNNNTTM